MKTIRDRAFGIARGMALALGVAVMFALTVGLASEAFGANGGSLILGKAANVATSVTGLVGRVASGAALMVSNPSGGPALELRVNAGKAPMKVNSSGKVANLNADRLDGKDAGQLVENAGKTTYTVFGPWVSGDPSVIVAEQSFDVTRFTSSSPGVGQRDVLLNPPLPSSLYGKSMLLTGVELCYNTSNEGVSPNSVELLRYSSSNASSAGGNPVFRDVSPTDGDLCRTYTGTPQPMGTNGFAVLQLTINWNAQTSFDIGRATFFLEPSNTPAAPL